MKYVEEEGQRDFSLPQREQTNSFEIYEKESCSGPNLHLIEAHSLKLAPGCGHGDDWMSSLSFRYDRHKAWE